MRASRPQRLVAYIMWPHNVSCTINEGAFIINVALIVSG